MAIMFSVTIMPITLICLVHFLLAVNVSASSIHGDHRAAHNRRNLLQRQSTTGFPLAATGSLSGNGLSSACERVLYQNVSCDSFVASLQTPAYRGSLGDSDFTATVCSTTCGTSLSITRSRIMGACASTPDIFSGYPAVALVDRLLGGWNETCLKDKTSGKYCNGQQSPSTSRSPTHDDTRHHRLVGRG
jgi:hypothetical protein